MKCSIIKSLLISCCLGALLLSSLASYADDTPCTCGTPGFTIRGTVVWPDTCDNWDCDGNYNESECDSYAYSELHMSCVGTAPDCHWVMDRCTETDTNYECKGPDPKPCGACHGGNQLVSECKLVEVIIKSCMPPS